ncbi:M24 family metallopeptidase [Longivirga aurantiaca]|uniref:M24 family metallopeptidase n=1 Tax=Longivirga aurantiaca TaxID=1837743 RepID=A0ABW1T0Y1_9ACTN
MTRDRRDRVRALLPAQGVDALLVTYLTNVRYLSGFSGSNGAVLVGRDPKDDRLITDFRYVTQAAAECPGLDVLVERAVDAGGAAHAVAVGASRLGFEAARMTVAAHESLRAAHRDLDLVPTEGVVEGLRTTKDDDELAHLAEACRISDAALAATLPLVRVGMTERQVARLLDGLMLDHGAEAVSFDTIVASGPNSAIPHHSPTDRAIERGDLLKIDFGALSAGYHADETRTFVVGADPEPWQSELHALVARAQQAGVDALAVGAELRDVDHAARSVIAAAGHAEHFGHGLGHGVGLDIHEAPMIGYSTAGILGDRTPVTVEPGVYLPGRGGVRIEDTLVVHAGGPVSLTTTTRELLVL